MGILILASSMVVLWGCWRLLRRPFRRRWISRSAGVILLLPGLCGLIAGGYWTWFTHRRQPAPVREEWFAGIAYERVVLQLPRPIVMHLVRVDLRTPGMEFVLTPVTEATRRPLKAATVSRFAQENGALVAINANYFYPFRAQSPLNYYPHDHDPVQVAGIAAYRGVLYEPHAFDPPADPSAIFYVSRDNHASFARPEEIYSAISGNAFLVKEAKNVAVEDATDALYPRTAIGLDATEETLFLAVVDGKQPGYSLGLTLPEFGDLLVKAGVETAINLDGGGSSSLVRCQGMPVLVSSPSNFRMPWWERPVGNHLGIKVGR